MLKTIECLFIYLSLYNNLNLVIYLLIKINYYLNESKNKLILIS